MRVTLFSLGVLAVLVAADDGDSTTTAQAAAATTAYSGSTECAAENIVDACLDTTQAYLSLCNAQDWACLCDKYTAILTCIPVLPMEFSSSLG
jgi:hypothetical protein